MRKLVICEKCHKGKDKAEMETVIGRTYKSKNAVRYYCKDCMSKILEYQEKRLQWEKEKNERK